MISGTATFLVVVLTGFDYPVGTWTVATIALIIPALVVGWLAARKRVLAIAAQRVGDTGAFPVVANLPVDEGN
ncbi:hypothetical protein OHA40_21325 [Nocardia sp. NBC_00508]|uniref:hypothetical protein n=1 Tax=Nocardia sp. NBC_00508 TaxID=2975992 RepID=UPI002E805EF7|nr:hypothetical protein [Nocardia sp. NBC_00508]WUD64243.1 hypothetical protein OHA40_21325 [Nocardia sp. NBC_00508]